MNGYLSLKVIRGDTIFPHGADNDKQTIPSINWEGGFLIFHWTVYKLLYIGGDKI